jgi:hypothetical protein
MNSSTAAQNSPSDDDTDMIEYQQTSTNSNVTARRGREEETQSRASSATNRQRMIIEPVDSTLNGLRMMTRMKEIGV